jgi:hypothetical protein
MRYLWSSPIYSILGAQNYNFAALISLSNASARKLGLAPSLTCVSCLEKMGIMYTNTIAGHYRNNPWSAVPEWRRCRNADAGLIRQITGKTNDAGLNFFRYSDIFILINTILWEKGWKENFRICFYTKRLLSF